MGLNGPLVGTLSPWSQSLTMTSHHTSTVPFFKLAASHCILVLGLLTAQLLFPQLGNAADTWPDYRGPRGDGHVAARGDAKMHGIPIHSSDTKNVQWKTRLPLLGLSSPVVMDDRIWLAHPNRATNVPVRVNHSEGVYETRINRQTHLAGENGFHSLGTVQFHRD
ncbi:MAG TPA: hypothetical protein DHV39_16305 [Verrucomicrobiales bacterium]|nr:hypothetical protein [Verrucomicrobiales bacterium]